MWLADLQQSRFPLPHPLDLSRKNHCSKTDPHNSIGMDMMVLFTSRVRVLGSITGCFMVCCGRPIVVI